MSFFFLFATSMLSEGNNQGEKATQVIESQLGKSLLKILLIVNYEQIKIAFISCINR